MDWTWFVNDHKYMKIIGFVIIAIALLSSLFKLGGAELDKGILTLAAMILLLSLYSDLKEFNFWGLWGKKEEKMLKELERIEGKRSIGDNTPSPDPETIQEVQKETPLQLMDTDKGNFLELAFEIERILKIATGVILGGQAPKKGNLVDAKLLTENGFLTDNGFRQVEGIRWLRNMLVHGRGEEVNKETLATGIQVALSFYTELNNWLQNTHAVK